LNGEPEIVRQAAERRLQAVNAACDRLLTIARERAAQTVLERNAAEYEAREHAAREARKREARERGAREREAREREARTAGEREAHEYVHVEVPRHSVADDTLQPSRRKWWTIPGPDRTVLWGGPSLIASLLTAWAPVGLIFSVMSLSSARRH